MSVNLLSLILLTLIVGVCSAQSPATMIKQPQHEQLFQVAESSDEIDRPFLLECEANGEPEPTYRWVKNGVAFDYLEYDYRISRQPNRGTLVFSKPDYVDEGVYQCFAHNKHGTSVSNTVRMRRAVLDSFPEKEVIQLYVTEGEPTTIECDAPNSYPKASIFWVLLSNTGVLRSINSSRITVDPEGRLHFSNVTRMDQFDDAMYACSATVLFRNEYKIGQRTILYVDEQSSGETSIPPLVQYVSPPSVVALREQALELHCIFGGTPLPDIVWSKRGASLSGFRNTYKNYGKTLIINKVEYNDEGTYECTASNFLGSKKSFSNRKMQITVQSAPFWLKSPNNTIKTEGESVKFECIASGTPEPKLQWFVNGIPVDKLPLNIRRKIEGNVMTIENLIETIDTAVYQCNASNIHGYVFSDFYLNVVNVAKTELDERTSSATLTVPDVPKAPEIIGVNCDGFTATIEWKSTDDRITPVLSYVIQHITSFSPDYWVESFVNIRAPQTKFKAAVSPSANHAFRVTARNRIGSSKPSGPSRCLRNAKRHSIKKSIFLFLKDLFSV